MVIWDGTGGCLWAGLGKSTPGRRKSRTLGPVALSRPRLPEPSFLTESCGLQQPRVMGWGQGSAMWC